MAEAPASRETQISLATSSMFPGFRFSPTDEELISYYLKKKLECSDPCVQAIAEVEICNHEPWDLPENEWFFFSPRGRKYPNGLQSKRATESGYWKATGKERNVKSGSNQIGTKRTLVFHLGRAPRGERTEWIMHEYCMSRQSQDSLVVCRLRKNIEFRLNDSPRQGSSRQRHLSAEDNSNVSSSEVGVEQSGLLEGAKAGESCSKEGSSSYKSHAVEQQVDCGSDSDQKLMNEFSQLVSCSHQGGDDEDCYADILKDDIIDLGESLLPPARSRTPDFLAVIAEKSEDDERSQQPGQEIPSSGDDLPPQGLAKRRIRLKQKKPEHYGATEPLKVEASNKNYSVKKLNGPQPEQQPPKCLLGLLSDQRVKRRRSMPVAVFVILALLALLVSFLGVPWQVKRFMCASML